MSLSSMANLAIQRQRNETDTTPGPRSLKEMASADGGGAADTTITAAMKTIVAYIPTEIVTIYVAVLAAAPPAPPGKPEELLAWQLWAFGIFLFTTPVAVWVLYAVKTKAGGSPLPKSPGEWPIWEMAAATICYVAWAGAMPQSPLQSLGYGQALASVVMLVVTTAVGMVAPLFQKTLPVPK